MSAVESELLDNKVAYGCCTEKIAEHACALFCHLMTRQPVGCLENRLRHIFSVQISSEPSQCQADLELPSSSSQHVTYWNAVPNKSAFHFRKIVEAFCIVALVETPHIPTIL